MIGRIADRILAIIIKFKLHHLSCYQARTFHFTQISSRAARPVFGKIIFLFVHNGELCSTKLEWGISFRFEFKLIQSAASFVCYLAWEPTDSNSHEVLNTNLGILQIPALLSSGMSWILVKTQVSPISSTMTFWIGSKCTKLIWARQ